jgi:hypothetical protein
MAASALPSSEGGRSGEGSSSGVDVCTDMKVGKGCGVDARCC